MSFCNVCIPDTSAGNSGTECDCLRQGYDPAPLQVASIRTHLPRIKEICEKIYRDRSSAQSPVSTCGPHVRAETDLSNSSFVKSPSPLASPVIKQVPHRLRSLITQDFGPQEESSRYRQTSLTKHNSRLCNVLEGCWQKYNPDTPPDTSSDSQSSGTDTEMDKEAWATLGRSHHTGRPSLLYSMLNTMDDDDPPSTTACQNI